MNSKSTYYPEQRIFHASCENIMGTRLDALLLDGENRDMESLWAQCLSTVGDLEARFSKFIATSDTSRVNAAEPLSLVPVSSAFRDIVSLASDYCDKTLGTFDISLGQHAGFRFDYQGNLIIGNNGLSIDLGGIAKGYALHAITQQLRRGGISNAIINFGGSSIMALGSHPAGDSWPVTVSDPFTRRPLHTFYLNDASLSTSGNTPHYNGHIINPLTARAITGDHLSAIVATSAIDAEVLSTAWIVADSSSRQLILNNFDTVIDEFRYN